MNCHWWKLRSEIQGLKPPSMRNNTQFDAGAKYHVAADVGYVRYFTAFIYEFQFYRELCLASGRKVITETDYENYSYRKICEGRSLKAASSV